MSFMSLNETTSFSASCLRPVRTQRPIRPDQYLKKPLITHGGRVSEQSLSQTAVRQKAQ